MSRQTKYFAVLWAILIAAVIVTARRSLGQTAPPPAPYTVEQEWIVQQVVRGIIDVSSVSTHRRLSTASGVRVRGLAPPNELLQTNATYQVTPSISGLPRQLRIVDHVWDAKTYAPIARALLSPTAETATDDDESLATALTDPSIDHLLAASERVSARLAQNPRSASAHDLAALVVGALALKEVARDFSDVRPALNRMTVHLAVAQALQPSTVRVSRSLATAIVSALVGRQRDALRIADGLDASPSAGVRAWGRAVRLRVTGDWRAIHAPSTLTRLEQAEYLRAVFQRRGYGKFLEAYDRIVTVDGSWDQQRLTLLGSADVETGTRFAESNVRQQLEEARHLWQEVHKEDPTDEALIAALNEPTSPNGTASSGQSIQVIDWGLWAAFAQRHLCESVARWAHHNDYMLGLPQRGQEIATAANARLASLRLYPIAAVSMARNQTEYARAITTARALLADHPELISAPAWMLLRHKPDFANKADTFPRDDAFFRPHVPTGTAFELRWRALQTPCERPVPIEAVQLWSQTAPYDTWAAWYTPWPDNQPKPTMAQARGVLSTLLDYDLNAARYVYDEVPATPAELLLLARVMCTIEENYCNRVGDQLLRDGQEGEAAIAYEHYISKARSRVAVSQRLEWLITYYEERGLAERATALARDAADTYSAAGLAAYATLLDRRGEHARAEELYQAIRERYENSTDLASHYLLESRRTHDAALEAKAMAIAGKTFPQGVERVTLTAFSNPPTDGIVFHDYGRRAERIGLRMSDVIVAVDGIRVRNHQQYWYVIRSGFDTRVPLIVWREGGYRELNATIPQRSFGATFQSYEPTRAAAPSK